jgi:tetratricopeptide (TPR) repeat protein
MEDTGNMNMRNRRYAWAACAFLTLAAAAFARNEAAWTHNPFEPTVTREESNLLKHAMAVAQTNSLEAIRMLEAGKDDDASPAIDFAIGNLHFQADRLNKAAEAYRAAIAGLPTFRSAMVNLGRIYLLQARTADAIALYQSLVADGQADADTLLLLGHALLMEDAPVSAEAAYRQSLLLRPKHGETMLGMTKALMKQERYAEALALVGEILTRDPENRELWSLRANAYLSMGKYAEAIRTLEKARRLNCADAGMLATLGDLLLNRNQPEDAVKAYQRAFDVETPALDRMLRAAEGFLMLRETDAAERMIRQAGTVLDAQEDRLDTATATKHMRLQAELALQQQRVEEAMAHGRAVLEVDPLDGRTLLMLAELQQQTGRLEDAVMTCERAARVEGFQADALVRQAQIEVQRERYRRAVTLLEAAQAFDDRPYVARYLEQLRRMAEYR